MIGDLLSDKNLSKMCFIAHIESRFRGQLVTVLAIEYFQ